MPERDIFSILHIPPPGRLPSAGPGTGPAQADSTQTDTARGGGRVPKNVKPAADGYGGGPDTVDVARPLSPVGAPVDLAEHLARTAQRTPPGPLVPEPNELFDGARSREAWKDMIVLTASGTFTPATGSATNTFPVTYDQTAGMVNSGVLRLDQFPRGTHAYPVLNYFTFASLATGGTGIVEFLFQAQNGSIPVPIGMYNLTALNGQFQPQLLIDAQIVDPGNLTAGLLVVVSRTVATPTALSWRIGFGMAYMVPAAAQHGYSYTSPLTRGRAEETYRITARS